jgi:hypothetical protein
MHSNPSSRGKRSSVGELKKVSNGPPDHGRCIRFALVLAFRRKKLSRRQHFARGSPVVRSSPGIAELRGDGACPLRNLSITDGDLTRHCRRESAVCR